MIDVIVFTSTFNPTIKILVAPCLAIVEEEI